MTLAIYLDSEALIAWGTTVGSTRARAFLRLAGEMGAKVFVPEAVVREVAYHSGAEIRNQLASTAKKLEVYRDLSSALGINFLPSLLPLSELQDRIAVHLRKELQTTTGIEIIPNARVESETLLSRSLKHIPPFASQNDRGLRDTIIYLTVVEHMTGQGIAEAILVTKDGDFQGPSGVEAKHIRLTINNIEIASDTLRQHLGANVARQEKQKDEAVIKLIASNAASLEQWIADRNRFVFSEQLLCMRLPPGATIISSGTPALKATVRVERAPADAGDPRRYKATCEALFSLSLDITYAAFSQSSTPLASGDSAGGITIMKSEFQQMQTARAIIEYPIMFDLLVTEEGTTPARFEIIGARDRDALLGALLDFQLSTRMEPTH